MNPSEMPAAIQLNLQQTNCLYFMYQLSSKELHQTGIMSCLASILNFFSIKIKRHLCMCDSESISLLFFSFMWFFCHFLFINLNTNSRIMRMNFISILSFQFYNTFSFPIMAFWLEQCLPTSTLIFSRLYLGHQQPIPA